MTINYLTNFKNSVAPDFDGVFNWDYLQGVFPRSIMPMDWDGVVEINGNYLVFETKDEGKDVPQGQLWALKRATQVGPFIVLIIWGKESPTFYQTIYKGITNDQKPCDKEAIRGFCGRWAKWAEDNPKIKIEKQEQLTDTDFDDIAKII